jgi:hypothetical protein
MGVGVIEGGVCDRAPMCVYCVINAGLVEQWAFPCEMLWGAKGGTAGACECFGGVRRSKPLCVRTRECVVNCELKCSGGGAARVEGPFGLLAP